NSALHARELIPRRLIGSNRAHACIYRFSILRRFAYSDYTVTPAINSFTYCCSISFHPGCNTLKLNEAVFADTGEPSA
ncbi:TPA: hypothetical protein ACISYW_002898, partial [Salmonella enterica subsp. diarizonae serovar 61:l,v:z35]